MSSSGWYKTTAGLFTGSMSVLLVIGVGTMVYHKVPVTDIFVPAVVFVVSILSIITYADTLIALQDPRIEVLRFRRVPWERNSAFLYKLERLVYNHACMKSRGDPVGLASASARKALAKLLPDTEQRRQLLRVQDENDDGLVESHRGDASGAEAAEKPIKGGGAGGAKVVPAE